MLAAVLTAAGALGLYMYMPVSYTGHDRGIVLPSANFWLSADRAVSLAVNVLAVIGISLLIDAMNRTFNMRRSASTLDSVFFLFMMLSAPPLLLNLATGTVLSIVLLGCMMLLFTTYADAQATRQVFIIFLILSAMTMTQHCYLPYILVFAIGTLQMRAFTGHQLMAMLLGLITPWWILAALAMVIPVSVHIPDLSMFLTEFKVMDNAQLLCSVGLAVLMLGMAWVGNFQEMIAYNAHKRAYNGTLSVLTLVTLIVTAADFSDVTVYAPVIFMLSAIQLGRLLGGRKSRAGNIAIIAIMATCIIIYASYPVIAWLNIW